MNPITAFLVRNIVGVYFFYGLAFFTMGLVLALARMRGSAFKFALALPAMAGFGLLHGIHEWYEMFQRMATISGGHVPTLPEESIRVLLLAASFLLLSAFGFRLLRSDPNDRWKVLTPVIILAALWLVATTVAATILDSTRSEIILLADVLSRYCLAVPGALLGAWALMVQQRTFREHGMPRFGRDLVWCATALILYGVIGQLFVHPSPLAPSNILNSSQFLNWFGVPVQVFRATMATILTVFLVRAMDAFELEEQHRLENTNEELRLATQELSLLLDMSNLLAAPEDLQNRLEGVLGETVKRLHFPDAGAILLTSRRTGTIQERVSVGYDDHNFPADSKRRHKLGLDLGEQCISKAMAVCRHLDGELIEFLPRELEEQEKCRDRRSPVVTIGLPLSVHNEVIGGLVLDGRPEQGSQDLTYEEFTIILGAAQQLGLSIENARLYEDAQEHEKRLGDLLHQVVDAQEAERQRIALELHDATGQSLTAVALGLRGVEAMLQDDPTKVSQQIGELRKFSTDALGELRRIISDLRPSQLDDLGLVAAIQWYVQEFEKLYKIPTRFTREGDDRLVSEYESVLFRIIQEGLTNVAKHARASQASIHLDLNPPEVVLTIQDDGQGFDLDRVLQSDRPVGWGLMGIQERALLLGGHCDIDSSPGEGSLIRVRAPLVTERENAKD
jgi:signal transduction histidine kinase